MTKNLLMFSLLIALAFAVGGCATKGELEELQAREIAISAKADQAALDAQNAKMAADEALLKANEAVASAEAAEKRALERERMADEKIKQAQAVFQNSMKK